MRAQGEKASGKNCKGSKAGLISRELNLESLEPYAVKVARTVLRGESGGNAADLLYSPPLAGAGGGKKKGTKT